MRSVSNVENLEELRKPNRSEVDNIGVYMQVFYNMKYYKLGVSTNILFLLGFILSIIGLFKLSQALYLILGLSFLVLSVCLKVVYKNCIGKSKYFVNGIFKVCDGYVSSIKEDNSFEVEFTSMKGDMVLDFYKVPKDGVEIGSHLLMIVQKELQLVKVVTDYALTQEGIQKYLLKSA